MYTLTGILVSVIIQLSSAQTSELPGQLTYICARKTSPVATTNYIELVYKYGTNDTLKSLYVQNSFKNARCMTQTKVTDDSNGHLILKIDDLKIPTTGSTNGICNINLEQNSGSGAITPDKDIAFLLTYQDTEVFSTSDFKFTIVKTECNFAATLPEEQTINNVEKIPVSGVLQKTVTAEKTVENLHLIVLKEDSTPNTYVITKTLSLGDKVKIRVDMKLPTRGTNSRLRVKSLTAYENCAKTSTAINLVVDYCAKPQLGMTDGEVGFVNTQTASMFMATLSKPFNAFMYGPSQTLCFSADVEFCANNDNKCAGDTCVNKAARKKRATGNSTTSATVSTAVVVSYDKSATATPVKDCDMFVHPQVFFLILATLLVLLTASVATAIYVVCHTKRRMRELQIKKLDENL